MKEISYDHRMDLRSKLCLTVRLCKSVQISIKALRRWILIKKMISIHFQKKLHCLTQAILWSFPIKMDRKSLSKKAIFEELNKEKRCLLDTKVKSYLIINSWNHSRLSNNLKTMMITQMKLTLLRWHPTHVFFKNQMK